MPKRIRIRVDRVTAEAELFDDRAPRAVQALWDRLPIRDRTVTC